MVNADINANVILISGTVKGNIKASSRVEIIKPARFEGTITTPSLIVEEGVIFHGTTKMREKDKRPTLNPCIIQPIIKACLANNSL